jgi:hypothetical protein
LVVFVVGVIAALALALVVVASASAGVLDQQQTTVDGANGIAGGEGGASWAQTFTAGLSGQLDRVDLYLDTGGDPRDGPLTVEIRNVEGGVPGSAVLASASVPATDPPLPAGFVEIPFESPATVVAGTQYAIVAYTARHNSYSWGVALSNAYADGGECVNPFSPPEYSRFWICHAIDLAFKTYVAPTISGVIAEVQALRLRAGIEKSLVAKLQGAQRNVDTGDTRGACEKLDSFASEVGAQSGKAIDDPGDADALINDAQAIMDSLGCAG